MFQSLRWQNQNIWWMAPLPYLRYLVFQCFSEDTATAAHSCRVTLSTRPPNALFFFLSYHKDMPASQQHSIKHELQIWFRTAISLAAYFSTKHHPARSLTLHQHCRHSYFICPLLFWTQPTLKNKQTTYTTAHLVWRQKESGKSMKPEAANLWQCINEK